MFRVCGSVKAINDMRQDFFLGKRSAIAVESKTDLTFLQPLALFHSRAESQKSVNIRLMFFS